MNKINVCQFGLAFGITFAVVYFACAVMMAFIGKNGAIFIFNSLMHGIDTTTIIRMDVPAKDAVVGIIETFAIGWGMGALIAVIYNNASRNN